MPLTNLGERILSNMKKQYGSAKKAKEIFYASIKKGIKGSTKWHGRKKSK